MCRGTDTGLKDVRRRSVLGRVTHDYVQWVLLRPEETVCRHRSPEGVGKESDRVVGSLDRQTRKEEGEGYMGKRDTEIFPEPPTTLTRQKVYIF